MEPSSPPYDLPSPSTIGRLIASYVQQSAEQHEERAHKALNILHQKDLQLTCLQERLADLESLKLTMSQNPQASQDHPKEESRHDRTDGNTRRRDQLPAGNPDKSSRVKNTENYSSIPARQIKSNVENLSEGSTLASSAYSDETKSQPNLQCWQKSNANAFTRQQNVKYVPVPCVPGKVSEKIQYYERPGCGDMSSPQRIAPLDVDERLQEGNEWRGEQCAAGIPRLDLPKLHGKAAKGPAKSGTGPTESNDDFVKRFLDVKLMEASIICQEMTRNAPRPDAENGKVVAVPETSVLYSIQKSRKSAVKSSSSESVDTLRSSRSRSRESLKDMDGGVPADGAPAAMEPQEPQYRRLIDHLMLYNRELKTELANVQTRTAQDREMHLAEVMTLQKCVLEMKETISAELSPANAKVHGQKTKSTLFSRNVSSQTEDGMFDSTRVEEESCSSDHHVEDVEAKGTSRTTQTERKMSRGCFCCSLGDCEVPPQWLLTEALAHANKAQALFGGTHRQGDEPKFEESVAQVEVKDASSSTMEICTKVACTQVDLSNPAEKDKTIETQEKDITALQRRVTELSQENVSLSETSRKKLDKERKAHQRIQLETEKKMINFCNIVAGDVVIPSQLFSSLAGEKSGDSSSGNSSRGSRKAFGLKMSARLTTSGSRWDVQATRRYVKTLKAKLRVLKSKGAYATERITDLTRNLALKDQALTALKKCVEELLSEVTQLRAAGQATKMFAGGLEDGTGDGVFPGDKVEKQADNARSQNVHTRLRNVNQQLITRSRALQNLQHEMKEMQNNMQNAKNRLSRSETLNQNKQLIIENYKRRLEEIVTKEVATSNRNSGLTTENHHLKDVINNLKKQISQLQSVKCQCPAPDIELGSRKIGQKLSSEKLTSNRSEDDLRTLVDFDRMRCNLENEFEEVAARLEKSEHRVAELQDTLERFLHLAKAHFASHSLDDADADGDASSSASRLETRTLACSILNLTHGQLDSMLGSGSTRFVSGDSQLVKWLDECERLYSSKTFAEKLASYLMEILKKLSANSRG